MSIKNRETLLASAFVRPQHDFLSIPEPRLGDGRICHILNNRVGREAWLLEGEGDAGAAGAAGAGAGGDAGKPKTYTQEEHQILIDKAIGQRLGEVTRKHTEALKSVTDKLAEIEREKTELAEKLETVGKSKEELERINADKAAKQIERAAKEAKERETALTGERDTWRGKYLDREVSDQLGKALDGAKVLGSARSKAIQGLRLDAEIAKDDDGRITSITYEGVAYDTVDKAAAAFLKNNPFFASNGGASGGGTKLPSNNSGGAGNGGRSLFEHSDEELLSMSNRQRATRS